LDGVWGLIEFSEEKNGIATFAVHFAAISG
jgi:hypothetical protein